jgi:hypothetical protein
MDKIPRIDGLSFWLGVAIASVFWFVFYKLRGFFPSVYAWIKQQSEVLRQQRQAGMGAYIHQDAFKRAQASHLSGSLFSLEEILITPHLIAPPAYFVHPDGPMVPSTVSGQVIPYLPDWPEASAQYHVEQLTLAQALQNGARIAVVGQPGMGKTVALAELAIQVARKDSQAGNLTDLIPIYFHILDIDFRLEAKSDPIHTLSEMVSKRVPMFVAPRMAGFFRSLLENDNVILIIDGLDELTPKDCDLAVRYLSTLVVNYPQIRICVAASPNYLDGLSRIGFFILGMAAWHNQEREQMIRKWSSAWDQYLLPDIRKKFDIDEIDSALLTNWIISDPSPCTPLELTLKLWSVYAGNMCGATNLDAIESYIQRLLPKSAPRHALEALACEFVKTLSVSQSFSDLEKFFSQYSDAGEISPDSENDRGENLSNASEKRRKKRRGNEHILSSSARTIQQLISARILVEHDHEQISFSNSVIQAYLASASPDSKSIIQLDQNEVWIPAILIMRYLAIQNKLSSWIVTRLIQEDLPLQQGLLSIARWLSDAPTNIDWRSQVMRQLVESLQKEDLPYPQRVRILGALFISNDSSLPIFFKQLLGSASPQVRKLAALGAGAIRDVHFLDDLLGLLVDPDREVRLAAALAIGSIGTPNGKRALSEMLLHGDEDLRQAVAEIMAVDPEDGHTTLKQALEVNDLLTRRAAIFGLAKIREDWVLPLLEKTSIEDSQWVVRNAASQALEELKSPIFSIPSPLPLTYEAAWLLKFASRQGVSIPKGDTAVELIVQALISGSHPEKMAAIAQFLKNPQTAGINEIYKLYYHETGPLQEISSFALWQIAASGLPLLQPSQVGLA